MDRVKLLSEYGAFLKNNHLKKLAEENRKFLTSIDLQLLKLCKDFSVDDLLKMSIINLNELLKAFDEGIVTEEKIADILKLELEALPGVKPEFIESNDLLSIYTAQKQAVFSFIPKFTTDTQIMMELIKELEFTFMKAMDFTLNTFLNQRIESVTRNTEAKVREETARYYIEETKLANEILLNKNEILDKVQEELKISYEELRNQNENLAKLQEALITRQETLVEKEIELIRSNQYLEQFANMASHDLKEPLRMVRQYVKLLGKKLKDSPDPDIKEFTDYAVNGVERMENLIKTLLDYAKLNKLGVPMEFTSTESVLEIAKMNLTVAIEESNAEITNDLLPLLKINEVQLTRLFQNLLSNALKYRSKDILTKIHIGAEKKENTWFFCVNDNGIGIEPDDFERIFIPFQRLHSNSEYEGLGLGLSFCKKIVEQYGGDMWVKSEPGKGTTFFFTIID